MRFEVLPAVNVKDCRIVGYEDVQSGTQVVKLRRNQPTSALKMEAVPFSGRPVSTRLHSGTFVEIVRLYLKFRFGTYFREDALHTNIPYKNLAGHNVLRSCCLL
jgi:hypothetical protein